MSFFQGSMRFLTAYSFDLIIRHDTDERVTAMEDAHFDRLYRMLPEPDDFPLIAYVYLVMYCVNEELRMGLLEWDSDKYERHLLAVQRANRDNIGGG